MTNPFKPGDRVRKINHPVGGAPAFGKAGDEHTVIRSDKLVYIDGETYDGGYHPEWFELVVPRTFAIGDPIPDLDAWNALPLGAVTEDRSGWVYTKIADGELCNSPITARVESPLPASTFRRPWRWGLTLISLPDAPPSDDDLRARIADLEQAETETREWAAELLAESNLTTQALEQANATAETYREDRDTVAAVLTYALENVPAKHRERILGYWDGLVDA